MRLIFFFFFQAEDGIRDLTVTGVQTCALPILGIYVFKTRPDVTLAALRDEGVDDPQIARSIYNRLAGSLRAYPFPDLKGRSEERRVGKECRSRWSPYH